MGLQNNNLAKQDERDNFLNLLAGLLTWLWSVRTSGL
jgi:hypothetical protein